MANFAVLDENDFVTGVYAVGNDQIKDENGNESEELGKKIISDIFGINDLSKIIQTFHSRKARGTFAGIGLLYDREKDMFLIPKRHPSWIFDESKKSYVPPEEMPNDGRDYIWDEHNKKWISVGNNEQDKALFQL